MALLKRRNGFDEKKFFIALLVSFVAIQLVSYLLSEIIGYPFLKMGWVLFLFLIIIVMVTLYIMGKNMTQLSLKKDGPFILFIFTIIVLLFIFIPKIVPEIFSIGGAEIREFLRQNVGTIIGLGPSGIA